MEVICREEPVAEVPGKKKKKIMQATEAEQCIVLDELLGIQKPL